MAGNNNQDRPKPIVIDIDRTTLYTDAPGAENQRATFGWSLYDTNTGVGGLNPRITVWPRVQGNDKPINIALNVVNANELLDGLERVLEQPDGTRLVFVAKGNKYENNEKLPGIHVTGKVHFGKDKDGIVWISAVDQDETRPKLQFKYGDSTWHHWEHKDGTRLTEAEHSVISARAQIRVLRQAFQLHLPLINEDERQRRKEARETRNGGFNNKKSNGNQRSSPSVDNFDDVSF